MPARIRKQHQDDIRQKIRGSILVHGLQRLATHGEVHDGKGWSKEWDPEKVRIRVTVALALLKKIVPDQHEVSGPDGGPIPITNMTDVEAARAVAFAMAAGAEAVRRAQQSSKETA